MLGQNSWSSHARRRWFITCRKTTLSPKEQHASKAYSRFSFLYLLCSVPTARQASDHPPCPPPPHAPAPPPRSKPPAATAPAPAARSRRGQGPLLPQRAQARPRRPAALRARGRGPLRARGADRPPHGRGRPRDRDRGPAGQAHGDRVLEERAGRADRGGFVRRRPQAPPAAGRLRVGGGRSPHHLRPQALQRRPRLPGPAGQGAVPLPEGAAPAPPRAARRMHGRTRADAAERTRRARAPANDDRAAHDSGSQNEPGGPLEFRPRRPASGRRQPDVQRLGRWAETSEPPTIRAEPQRGARVG